VLLRRIARLGAILIFVAITFLVIRKATWSPATLAEVTPGAERRMGLEAEPADELFFPEPAVNLGNRKGVVAHDFVFQNCGSSTITIEKITPSCSCTLIRPKRMDIEPDEQSSFGIQIDLTNEPRGFKRYLVDVRYKSEHLEAKRTRLELVLLHDPDVQLSPGQILLSGIVGDTVYGRFTVIDYQEQPLQISGIEESSRLFETRIVEKPSLYRPGWKWTFEVTANTAGLERFTTALHIHNDHGTNRWHHVE
jgi:hypothetical protein